MGRQVFYREARCGLLELNGHVLGCNWLVLTLIVDCSDLITNGV